MEAETVIDEETFEQPAEGISEGLEFLRREALEAGMFEVGELIGRALKKTRAWRSSRTPVDVPDSGPVAASAKQNAMSSLEFEQLRNALAALPKKYRDPLVLKTVYRSSYAEIADYCGISIDSAVACVTEGFELVRTYRNELHRRAGTG